MQDFLNKVGKQASKAADMAGNKTAELLEITKIKSKISDIKKVSEGAVTDMGEYIYSLYKEGKIDDPRLIENCEKIDAANAAIADLEMEIQQVKEEYAAKNQGEGPNLND